jgi:hypothetical protein
MPCALTAAAAPPAFSGGAGAEVALTPTPAEAVPPACGPLLEALGALSAADARAAGATAPWSLAQPSETSKDSSAMVTLRYALGAPWGIDRLRDMSL